MDRNEIINNLSNQLDQYEAERESCLKKLRNYIYEYQENEVNCLNDINDIISKLNTLNSKIEFLLNRLHQLHY